MPGDDERNDHDEQEPEASFSPSESERIWLHPSELGSLLPPATRPQMSPPTPASRRGVLRVMAVPVLSGMVGAALALGILLLAGTLDRERPEPVIERVQTAAAYDLGEPESVSQLVTSVSPALVTIRARTPSGEQIGTGLIFRSDGHILTGNHLVDGATSIEVISADGRSWTGHATGVDPESGVAVVAMPADEVEPAVLGSARKLRVGQLAVVVGAPNSPRGSPSATAGVIAALGEVIEMRGRLYYDLIATDALIGERAAGGPLVDRTGAVVGITTRMATSGTGDRLGLVVPIDLARRVGEELISHGRATYAWMGLSGTDLDYGTAEEYGVTRGTLVREVVPDGPAARAGIQVEDVVIACGRSPVASMDELMMLVRRHSPGERIVLTVMRSGVTHTLRVVLGETPPAGEPSDPVADG
ncbi:MAG: S1C family serine protease [Acidimicrobiia bacterium]